MSGPISIRLVKCAEVAWLPFMSYLCLWKNEKHQDGRKEGDASENPSDVRANSVQDVGHAETDDESGDNAGILLAFLFLFHRRRKSAN